MTEEYKTLRELNVEPGDVVHYKDGERGTVGKDMVWRGSRGNEQLVCESSVKAWRMVSRAYDPKLWGDMTPEEKGALLLAHHDGEVIEYHNGDDWHTKPRYAGLYDHNAYRIRPEPVRETVTLTSWGTLNQWMRDGDVSRVHASHVKFKITFDALNGKPVVGEFRDGQGNTIRIEEIK
jgi:hypothetical protein